MSGIMQALVAARANLGPDIVANGTFAAGTDWTDDSSEGRWIISGGKAVFAGSATGFTNSGGTAPTASSTYRVIYTISGYASGQMRVQIGGQYGTIRTANGTYSEDLVASTTDKLVLVAWADGAFSIDDVSAQEVYV